jgi:hypothetical protein
LLSRLACSSRRTARTWRTTARLVTRGGEPRCNAGARECGCARRWRPRRSRPGHGLERLGVAKIRPYPAAPPVRYADGQARPHLAETGVSSCSVGMRGRAGQGPARVVGTGHPARRRLAHEAGCAWCGQRSWWAERG